LVKAAFVEQSSPPSEIFTTLSQNRPDLQQDRYNVSKLLEILLIRELAPLISPNNSTLPPPIILNTLTPGLCHSSLMRHAIFPLNILARVGKAILARPTEVGSRTLVAAAAAGKETNGAYMADCVIREPSRWVRSEKGRETQRRVWEEVREILEGIEEGATACVGERKREGEY
jgi:retinol dehydrogenase-12